MDNSVGATYRTNDDAENDRTIPESSAPIDHAAILHIINVAMREADPQNPGQTFRLIEGLYANVIKYGKHCERKALDRYEAQLKEMATKIIEQRQEIDNLQRHRPLKSIAVTGEDITPEQLNVMTPPRDASYGSPYAPTDA